MLHSGDLIDVGFLGGVRKLKRLKCAFANPKEHAQHKQLRLHPHPLSIYFCYQSILMLRFGLSARLLPQSRGSFGRNVRKLSMFEKYPPKVGLYDKALEKDSCGVGLVANLKKVASRRVVVDANQMLVRMSHRGGCGCEPNSGDGAGKSLILISDFKLKVYDIL